MAAITFTDVASDRQLLARTSDLSVLGCFVLTSTAANAGTKLWISLAHAGVRIAALGKVIHVGNKGMGITFIKIESHDQSFLDQWINHLRANRGY